MLLVITYSNDRGIIEIRGKELNIDGGRHEHQFEVPSPLGESSEDTQEEISMDMTLMDLVYYHHVIPREIGVRGQLA